MVKIGILTYHNNENKGAILQAECLVTAFNEIYREETIELVDYRTISKEVDRLKSVVSTRNQQRTQLGISDYRQCNSYINHQLPISQKRITTNNHEKAVRELEQLKYDMVVVGSDEVWKIKQARSRLRGFMKGNRPFPNLYFLDPRLSCKNVAYAASANRTGLDSLDQETIERMKTHLEAFDLISVRDIFTEQLMKQLGMNNINRVPDPTLLIDIPDTDVTETLKNEGIDLDKPVLGVHTPTKPLFEDICENYREKGYQIVSPTFSDFADINLKSKLSPIEYYNSYSNFDMLITSSLHSTIFSVKNRTPFITVDVDQRYQGSESKTYSLLNDLRLLDRHYNAVESQDPDDLISTMEHFEASLDERSVKNRLSELRESGRSFIKETKNILHE